MSEHKPLEIDPKESLKKRKKILFITPFVQMETSSGGGIVTIERLSALVQHHDVNVLTMNIDNAARHFFAEVTWIIAGSLRPRNVGVLLNSYLKGLPLSVWRNTTTECIHAAEKLNKIQWDLIYLDHWLMIEVALTIKNSVRILNLHNAEPEVFFRASKTAPHIKKLVMLLEGYRSSCYLRKSIANFNGLHLLSNDDADRLKARGISHSNTKIFLPTVKQPHINPTPIESRRYEVLFVGTLSWHANEEGVIWYIEKVIGLLDPKLKHQIVGAGASNKLISMTSKFSEISTHGYVNDLEPFYQSTKCLVAPLLSGSGVKIKIINALARGLPVVTTPVGIEGFPSGYQEAIFVADTPEHFAREIYNLTSDNQLWSRASKNATNYFSQHFSGHAWQRWAEELMP